MKKYLNGKIWNGQGYNIKGKNEFTINEGKGYVKEYNSENGELLFEGEYLNSVRNGKGKEYYYNCYLKFEGEYLNGERNGKGKEYYYDIYSELKFEGEYLNGKIRNGQGFNLKGKKNFTINEGKGYVKEYNIETGELLFEGEYSNGEKNGKGKEYHDNGKLKFEGEYLKGERIGKGKEYHYKGNIIFEGEYLNG